MSLVPLLALVIKKSQNIKSNPQLSICAKKWKWKMYAPDHGDTEEVPVQIHEYVIPAPPRARKPCEDSEET